MKRILVRDSIAFIYIILWSYAAVSKLADYSTFKVQLGISPFLTSYAGILATGVPALELAISIFLIIPAFRQAGLYASYTLMLLFTGYVILILQFSDHIPCSCGGLLQAMSWKGHLVFNSLFTLLAVLAVLPHFRSEQEGSRKPVIE